MKKFILLATFLICLVVLNSPYSLSYFSKSYDGTHTFYCPEIVFNADAQIAKNGNGYLISVCTQNAGAFEKTLNNNYQGESFCFLGDENNLLEVLKKLNAKIVKKEVFDNLLVVYGFSPKLKNYILMKNQKVNVQIALNKNKITVGTPLILGSF
ncbi:MAG: YwmB family TATA-box binding protein [Clostridia bacterium]|nr:YwmB family TATA-box binding protein [Clostridia bacterium]